jgi:predicted aldo/keto reductase-like oxidoreductase
MAPRQSHDVSRRTFLQGAGAIGASSLLTSNQAVAKPLKTTLPTRVLGRTKQQVPILTLGSWPCGRSSDVDVAAVERLTREAIDLGVTLIDTARNYGKAEEGIGRGLKGRRDGVFLTTKVWADTADEAKASFEQSLKLLGTEQVDLLYLHSVGNRDVKQVLAKDGALSYLLKQKEIGTTRFIGLSGHSRVETFLPLIKTGQFDVVMMAMNFVDRHTYGFESKVLPAAREQNMGIICMKVFGGIRGGFAAADGPNPGPEMQQRMLQQAIRYALDLPAVASLCIGPHTVEQLRKNVEFVKNYTPLSDGEREELMALGKKLSKQWKEHYGPVV